jgi:PhoH-like ATPase
MRKTIVLDTSALVTDPTAYRSYQHCDICLPITIIQELDKLKRQPDEVGRNARIAIKLLDQISQNGDISTGILLEKDILLRIDTIVHQIIGSDTGYGDNQILGCAIAAYKAHPENDVCLISNDFNLRVRAKAYGLDAQGHSSEDNTGTDLYTGQQIIVSPSAGCTLLENGILYAKDFGIEAQPNECLTFLEPDGEGQVLARHIANGKIKKIRQIYPWKLQARNKEQSYAFDMIMDPNIDLITMIGTAGSGKTLCALACAIDLVLSKKAYSKLIVYRPVIGVDEGIGYLPGSEMDKLEPWLQPIKDNFEHLMGDRYKHTLELYTSKGQIEFSALTYIRGRSIPNAIILVDEVQNLTQSQVKTILTRAGENSKIILTGDISQIDAQRLDPINNGLTYAVEKFKHSELAGHITFTKGERSRLATLASEIL